MKTFDNIKTFRSFISNIDEDVEFPKKSRVKRPREKKIITIPDWGTY
jgi:hypothetical protein